MIIIIVALHVITIYIVLQSISIIIIIIIVYLSLILYIIPSYTIRTSTSTIYMAIMYTHNMTTCHVTPFKIDLTHCLHRLRLLVQVVQVLAMCSMLLQLFLVSSRRLQAASSAMHSRSPGCSPSSRHHGEPAAGTSHCDHHAALHTWTVLYRILMVMV